MGKVPTVQLREECSTTQLRVETSNPVQQCKDVIVTQCKKKFSHFPHRVFSSSRVLGTTSTLVLQVFVPSIHTASVRMLCQHTLFLRTLYLKDWKTASK